MSEEKLRGELEYIIKSHACTRIDDRDSRKDYPIMRDKILALIDASNIALLEELKEEFCFSTSRQDALRSALDHRITRLRANTPKGG